MEWEKGTSGIEVDRNWKIRAKDVRRKSDSAIFETDRRKGKTESRGSVRNSTVKR